MGGGGAVHKRSQFLKAQKLQLLQQLGLQKRPQGGQEEAEAEATGGGGAVLKRSPSPRVTPTSTVCWNPAWSWSRSSPTATTGESRRRPLL